MELHQLERRKDWPVIVGAVKCPTCQAGPTEQCRQLGLKQYRSLMSPSPRLDFHQERKKLAAKEFEKSNNKLVLNSDNEVEVDNG